MPTHGEVTKDSADAFHRVSHYYRRAMEGHVFIRETIDALLDALGDRIAAARRLPRVLELGSHTGVITEMLLERWPALKIIVHDDDEELVAMARRRLAGKRVEFRGGALDALEQPVDLVLSVARHHHLPHDYLTGVRRIIQPDGAYLLADELCPEYCEGEHVARIAGADVLHIEGGYVLTSRADIAAFRADGTLPGYATDLEERRRRALWRWYRFVVDRAVDSGYFDVAAAELQSARDDLVTGSDAEHKFGPLIVERQFSLAGFELASKRIIGPTEDAEHQGMFVYEFRPGGGTR